MCDLRIIRITSLVLPLCAWGQAAAAREPAEPLVLHGAAGVDAVFDVRGSTCRWVAYRDTRAGRQWDVEGPYFSLETETGIGASIGKAESTRLFRHRSQIVLETDLVAPPLSVRRAYSFCADGRTLRIETSLRASDEPVAIRRIGLLEIAVAGERPRLTGSRHVSHPVLGERFFAGIEHPVADGRVQDDTLSLSQSSHSRVADDWVDFPAAPRCPAGPV